MHAPLLVQRRLTSGFRRVADESIPSARDGGHVAWVGRFVAERPPQHEDALGQVRLFDDRVWPDSAHEVVLLNRPAAVFEQDLKDVDCLGRYDDRFPIAQEAPPRDMEREGTKHVNL
jgi:hypothetical protein